MSVQRFTAFEVSVLSYRRSIIYNVCTLVSALKSKMAAISMETNGGNFFPPYLFILIILLYNEMNGFTNEQNSFPTSTYPPPTFLCSRNSFSSTFMHVFLVSFLSIRPLVFSVTGYTSVIHLKYISKPYQ